MYIYKTYVCIDVYLYKYIYILRQIQYRRVSASGAPPMEHGPQTPVETLQCCVPLLYSEKGLFLSSKG